MDFTLAHLTDPHLTPLGAPSTDLLGKRVMGYLSWHLNRRRRYQRSALDVITADMARSDWDHCVVTGDLTQIATSGEIRAARDWLNDLGSPGTVSVIPGNHDNYGRGANLTAWHPWTVGDAGGSAWPMLRQREGLSVIGVSSAVVSPPGFATGTVGRAQLHRLREILGDTRGTFRAVLIHHPPLVGHTRRRKALTDADDFMEILGDVGAELILHGHGHRNLIYRTPVGERLIPVASLGSASATHVRPERRAAWQRIRIRSRDDGWHVHFERRSVVDGQIAASPSTFDCNVAA